MFLLAACSTDCAVWADAVPLTSASAAAQLHSVFDMSPPCARSEIQRHRPLARRRLWLNDVSQPFYPRLSKRPRGREADAMKRIVNCPTVCRASCCSTTNEILTPTIPARWRSRSRLLCNSVKCLSCNALLTVIPLQQQRRSTRVLHQDIIDNLLAISTLPFASLLHGNLSENNEAHVVLRDACEIIITFTCARANAEKIGPDTPGTPIIPFPSIEMIARSSIDVTVLATLATDCRLPEMSVPSCVGLNVFFILIGIFFSIAGTIVFG